MVPVPILAMLFLRFIRYLWPRASKKVPRGLRKVLGCLQTGVFVPKTPIRAIQGANYSDLPTPSSTLYRRTRLMTQYEKIKEQYKDYILLFQVGDFYEIYGEDASKFIMHAHVPHAVYTVSIVMITTTHNIINTRSDLHLPAN